MKPSVAVLTDPRSQWAKVARAAIQDADEVFLTSNETRLKRLVAAHPAGILVIIDAIQTSRVGELITEVKKIHPNVVVLAATSSRTWDEAVSFMKSGASDVVLKTMDPQQLSQSLKAWQVRERS